MRRLVSDFTAVAVGLFGGLWWLKAFSEPTAATQDFEFFYTSARALADGHPAYTPGRGIALLPPHALLCLRPLLNLDLTTACYVWLLINILAVAASAYVVASEVGWRPTWRQAAWLVALPALWLHAMYGQCAWLLALPMAAGWRFLREGRDVRAAALFGLVTAVKPFLLPLGLLFLWRLRWKAAASWCVAGGAFLLVGVWRCGLGAYTSWLTAERLVHWYDSGANASIVGVAARLANAGAPLRDFTSMAVAMWVAGTVCVASVSCWSLRGEEDWDRDLAVVLLAALLVFPLGWVYYLPLVAGPVVGLALRSPALSRRYVLCALPLWWPAGVGWVAPSGPTLVGNVVTESFYFFGLSLLWLCAATGRGPARFVGRSRTATCSTSERSRMVERPSEATTRERRV